MTDHTVGIIISNSDVIEFHDFSFKSMIRAIFSTLVTHDLHRFTKQYLKETKTSERFDEYSFFHIKRR